MRMGGFDHSPAKRIGAGTAIEPLEGSSQPLSLDLSLGMDR